MNLPVEYLIGAGVVVASIVATYVLTKRRYQAPARKSTKKADVNRPLSAMPNSAPNDDADANLNLWKLEVNGTAKFDIKVEWSDGDVMTFSGEAPEVYTMRQERGVLPTNTAGIAPEWADDGISYQWYLNGHHWC